VKFINLGFGGGGYSKVRFPFDNTFTLKRTALGQVLKLNSNDGDFSMVVFISNIMITDGFGEADSVQEETSSTLPFSPINLTGRVRNTVPANHIGHWTKLEYDPTLSSVFLGGPDGAPSARNLSSKLSNGAIAAIATSLVVVVIIVAVLVFTFVPAARKIVRPFSDRDRQTGYAGSVEMDSSSSAVTSPSQTPRATTTDPKDAQKSLASESDQVPSMGWTRGTKAR
jgi:hypothetical protein